jgi:hypothetical protein
MDAFDSHLVLSFVGETRLLAISEEDVLDEAAIEGFDADSQTLLSATTLHDHLLQVSQCMPCSYPVFHTTPFSLLCLVPTCSTSASRAGPLQLACG